MKRDFYKPLRPQLSFCYCSGKPKICYASREAALSERNKTFKRDLQLRAYPCPRKGARLWHLTSKV